MKIVGKAHELFKSTTDKEQTHLTMDALKLDIVDITIPVRQNKMFNFFWDHFLINARGDRKPVQDTPATRVSKTDTPVCRHGAVRKEKCSLGTLQ